MRLVTILGNVVVVAAAAVFGYRRMTDYSATISQSWTCSGSIRGLDWVVVGWATSTSYFSLYNFDINRLNVHSVQLLITAAQLILFLTNYDLRTSDIPV